MENVKIGFCAKMIRNPVNFLTAIFRDAEDLVEERFTALQARGFKSVIFQLYKKNADRLRFSDTDILDTFFTSRKQREHDVFDKLENRGFSRVSSF